MNWMEVRVRFDAPEPEAAAELIAEAFGEIGVEGVIIDDPRLDTDADWGDDALPPPAHDAVRGYLAADVRFLERREQLVLLLKGLERRNGIRCRLSEKSVDEEDWAESWKEHFWPIKMGRRIVVKPTWRNYAPEAEDLVIELDPGMAFGTGSHATTMLCVQALEDLVTEGMRVLDVGTGSGILLAAAAKLGARTGLGIDLDPVAVTVARENLSRNDVPADRFELREGDLAGAVSGRYDLVVANILSAVVIRLLPQIPMVCAPGACLIFSGIVQKNQESVLAAMADHGLDILAVRALDDWVAVIGRGPEI
ncbi:MAG: 50S ribosomal protein L11 methyltransferase [Pseudomonadota bacterium]